MLLPVMDSDVLIDAVALSRRFSRRTALADVSFRASRGESVEMACIVHGLDPDEVVAKINEFLAAQ